MPAATRNQQEELNRLAGQVLDRMDSVLEYDRAMDRDAEKDAEAMMLGILVCVAIVVIIGAGVSIWLVLR